MKADFLFELGTEELPPKSLLKLRDSLRTEIVAGLASAELNHGQVLSFATPRRLAVVVESLDGQQAERTITRKGPAIQAAKDKDGNPSKAAMGFARSCGVDLDQISTLETDKGAWLYFEGTETGKSLNELITPIIQQALKKLPIAKRMRWGDRDDEFVRPVKWLICRHGEQAIGKPLFDLPVGLNSQGHRFHAAGAVALATVADYENQLQQAYVIASFEKRRDAIRQAAEDTAAKLGGSILMDEELLDEITALNEWPQVITGRFADEFLQLPEEVIVSTLQENQRYFCIRDQASGKLLPNFITFANIASLDPNEIAKGNEKVVTPRLADAMFFWQQDKKQALQERLPALDKVVFQKDLGSVGAKVQRIQQLAERLAPELGAELQLVSQAAQLAKCDLMTDMVYEFTNLQGVMGYHYALAEGQNPSVALAIKEHYEPNGAGAAIPSEITAQVLALADKLDTLAGIFAIGKTPTGDKDPFSLRRAALGVVRIAVEAQLPLDLHRSLQQAVAAQPVECVSDVAGQLYDFIMQRFRAWQLDQGLNPEIFDAVLAKRPTSPVDFLARAQAVQQFATLPEAAGLAEANKRIRNILRKAKDSIPAQADATVLTEPAEQALLSAVSAQQAKVEPLLANKDYKAALLSLAELHQVVDKFFIEVMVMAEDEQLRQNRLALLANLQGLFSEIADISVLQQTQ